MARKLLFTREDVLDAAFSVVEKDGLSKLTARRVAEQLGASTAPVYSNYTSMDELEMAVLQRAKDLLLDYATRHHTDDRFLNMGVGVLVFAREHCNVFRALFLDQTRGYDPEPDLMPVLLEILAGEQSLVLLSVDERERLLHHMAIFSHGLATWSCTSPGIDTPLAESVACLEDVGGTLVHAALREAGVDPAAHGLAPITRHYPANTEEGKDADQ
jgi:AcrR family transcriptional regulator